MQLLHKQKAWFILIQYEDDGLHLLSDSYCNKIRINSLDPGLTILSGFGAGGGSCSLWLDVGTLCLSCAVSSFSLCVNFSQLVADGCGGSFDSLLFFFF